GGRCRRPPDVAGEMSQIEAHAPHLRRVVYSRRKQVLRSAPVRRQVHRLHGGLMQRTNVAVPAAVFVLLLWSLLVAAHPLSGSQPPANGSGRGRAAATMPALAYKQVEWPTPPTSAAGVPGAWNFIQAASVAVSPRGTIYVLHRGAHPVIEFDSSGTLIRSFGDGMFSEGKVAAIA